MTDSKKLLEYIKSTFVSSDTYMSALRDGIRCIYELDSTPSDLCSGRPHTATLIGICARGTFYSLCEEYRSVGKDYMTELLAFEELYNSIFDRQMKAYSAQNPVGGKVSDETEKRLAEFEKRDMKNAALDLIFGNYEIADKPVDHGYFEPLFLRYLLLGNKSVDDAVAVDIREHADELNFTLLSEERAYRCAARLLREENMAEKISLYGKIRQLHKAGFNISVIFENTVIENIEIGAKQLLRLIKYNETFTYKNRLIISFDDIAGIKCGEESVYQKSV